ncbi:MAG: HDIG domain-containing protein [Acidimicrobiia bacterium]|nr:HDIG domain-containing protein [Acidimicrobiia bacterium]NNC74972.1 HDIG domain-containing protein [Acidimicrobiia bacterium]
MTSPWRSTVLTILVLAVTVVAVALSLVVGKAAAEPAPDVTIGRPAPETFIAPRFEIFVDEEATEDNRDSARLNTAVQFKRNPESANQVTVRLLGFFQAVRSAAVPIPPAESADPIASTSTTVAESEEAAQETTTTTTTTLPRPEEAVQVESVQASGFLVLGDVVEDFVSIYNRDLDRALVEEPVVFGTIEDETLDLANQLLADGIKEVDLAEVRQTLVADPPFIFVAGLPEEERDVVQSAISRLVAAELRSNLERDDTATDALQESNASAVTDVTIVFRENDTIVSRGELVSTVQEEAIVFYDLLVPEEGPRYLATTVLGALAVLLAAFFLWRVAPSQWSEPRHFALLGVLLVLAALSARIPEIVSAETSQAGYVLPAMVLGYLAAILFDPRTATLMAIPVAFFTGIATGDPGLTVFAAGATVTPIAFVSSVSSRRELRVAVALSAVTLAPLGAASEWMFGTVETMGRDVLAAAGFAFLGGVVGGLVAQGLLSFLENIFRVTTTLTLLDLTDRNHPALRLIEEEAPGTFNHCILVGTMAGKAARAIGADPLLAQAAAYYHDLGKTEKPGYFIENQFGVSNPHDELPPEESAEIVRGHVLDGLRLARQFRLPKEVSDGIRMHHGTGLMRFFYHKALEDDPAVDPELFRHRGTKPNRKEMAIVMLCDAVEGAARALAQREDPSPDSLRKLVESIVGEKVDDGQLDESALTFGDLTRVKDALVEALVGYYHARIHYPGFPQAATT